MAKPGIYNDIIYSFPPVSSPDSRVLILGTMPGIASLEAGEYYAHPRNSFWKIMGDLFGAGPGLPYPRRLEILKENKVAVWDVLQCCVRPGSLDSSISEEAVNDFNTFFTGHSSISHIFFNGAPAAKFFKKFVTGNSKTSAVLTGRKIILTPLPSTSPANAGWSYARKLKAWRVISELQ